MEKQEIAGKAAFLGDLAVLAVSTMADYESLGLFSVAISKKTGAPLTFGILGHVYRL